ncbi:MAG: hypothetical protein QNJ77_09665 [Acidimicrobiia bacterium]|nr:hypothetical protein [Acidimicrobiia bacterium]
MEGLDVRRPRQLFWGRRIGALLVIHLVVGMVLAQLGIAFAATETFYLRGDGTPTASMSRHSPEARPLPNYDPERDSEPGLVLAKSDGGSKETDPTKYQQWLAADSPLILDGPASLTLWSAMKDYDDDKQGKIKAYLQDCDPEGSNCAVISTAQLERDPWDDDSEWWIERTLDFGYIAHKIEEGRALAVKLVVRGESEDDMWFAYDTAAFPSALNVVASPPPPETTTTTTSTTSTTTTTTTTTTSTTTTTLPPPSTTTTHPPATTTTTTTTTHPPATTTTTTTTTHPPATTTTTTTTTHPPATTTTTTTTTHPPATTTTTTTAPPVGESSQPEPSPRLTEPGGSPEDDPALAALPVGDSNPPPADGALNTLFAGLEVVIPPPVAAAVLSPLVLVGAIAGAFTTTGRELLLPGVLLVCTALWVVWRSRDADDEEATP